MNQIGTIEVLRSRVYPLDAALGHDPLATTVVVEPGTFPVYSDGLSHFWMMTGQVNVGRMHRLGDGIFTMSAQDEPSGFDVTFPSRTYGPDEWVEFTASETCRDGDPEQRLRLRLWVSPSR